MTRSGPKVPNRSAHEPLWRRASGVLETDVSGVRVLLNPATWRYTELNDTAARIWDLLAESRSVETLANTLAGEYAIDVAACRSDVTQCLTDLKAAQLVDAHDRDT